jgi:hypothetical protein
MKWSGGTARGRDSGSTPTATRRARRGRASTRSAHSWASPSRTDTPASSRPASTPKRDAADADAGDLYLDARLMMSARPYDWLNQPMFLLLQM